MVGTKFCRKVVLLEQVWTLMINAFEQGSLCYTKLSKSILSLIVVHLSVPNRHYCHRKYLFKPWATLHALWPWFAFLRFYVIDHLSVRDLLEPTDENVFKNSALCCHLFQHYVVIIFALNNFGGLCCLLMCVSSWMWKMPFVWVYLKQNGA